jgi:serine/threonine protein kinase
MGREFWNEIETLQRIEHLNLVRFHGYLEFGGEQLIIVEYVPNGNLREHLDCKNVMVLSIYYIRIAIRDLELQWFVALYQPGVYLT